PELALAGVLGDVADVTVGGQDTVIGAEVALDRPRLGRRLDDHQVLRHSAGSIATGPCTAGSPPITSGSPAARLAIAGGRPEARSGLAHAAQEVLVDLEVFGFLGAFGLGGSGCRSGALRLLRTGRDLDEPHGGHREGEDRLA